MGHRGRHVRSRHDLLGVGLAALETSRLGIGAEAPETRLAQRVGDTRDERGLRTDDHEVDLVALGQPDDGSGIRGVDGFIAGECVGAGIAGRRDDGGHRGVEGECADESMLAGAGADDENLHVGEPTAPRSS